MASSDHANLAEGKPGIYLDLPMERYIGLDAIGRSDIALFLRSPTHFKWNVRGPDNPSDIKTIGSATNDHFLQRDVYDQTYYVNKIPIDKRTKVGKETAARLEGHYGKGNILTPLMESTIHSMSDALADTQDGILMRSGVIESTLYWNDDETNIPLRGRPDSIVAYPDRRHATIYDLKTTHDASEETFALHFYSFSYYLQAALYRRGLLALSGKLDSVDFKFLTVETTPPYPVRVYTVSEDDMAFADEAIDTVLRSMQHCIETDDWPGYSSPVGVSIPYWARKRVEREMRDLARTTFRSGAGS